MPVHRSASTRSATLTLDTLLDDFRLQNELPGGTLDLILMAYRYSHLFERELARFLEKPLDPLRLKDLLSVGFAALMTRTKTPPSAIVSEAVNVGKWVFGGHTSGLVNAFLRDVGRRKDELLEELEANPELLLGATLNERWKNIPEVRRRLSRDLAARPSSGIMAFDSTGAYQLRSIEELTAEDSAYQAMDRGSWALMQWIAQSALRAESDRSFLDACAAPGGKLLALLTLWKRAQSDLRAKSRVSRSAAF